MIDGINAYIKEVQQVLFPDEEHSFTLEKRENK